jgi:hypothetical protein
MTRTLLSGPPNLKLEAAAPLLPLLPSWRLQQQQQEALLLTLMLLLLLLVVIVRQKH